jgi:hypothetical protein
MHYAFAALGVLPEAATAQSVTNREFFELNYTFYLNLVFIAISTVFLLWRVKAHGLPSGGDALSDKVLFVLACGSLVWLACGLVLPLAGLVGVSPAS